MVLLEKCCRLGHLRAKHETGQPSIRWHLVPTDFMSFHELASARSCLAARPIWRLTLHITRVYLRPNVARDLTRGGSWPPLLVDRHSLASEEICVYLLCGFSARFPF